MSQTTDVLHQGISQSNKRALRNPWVLGWLALVAVVLGVNIVMITLAFTTNPGLVSANYYEKGRNYEETLQSSRAAHESLGWDLSLKVPNHIAMQRPAAFRVATTDKVGNPIAGATVMVRAYRPSDANADFAMPLAEAADGQYVGDLIFPLQGVWDLVVQIKQGQDSYEIARRVSVITN